MKLQKTNSILVGWAKVGFVTLCACLPCLSRDAAAEKLKVGLIAPLTGPLSQHGAGVLNGLKLGLQKGKCENSVDVSYEDDGFDPMKSVTAARKLLNQKNVDLLLGVGSGPSHAIAPLAEHALVPFLTLAGDSTIAKGRRMVVRLRPPATDEGSLVAKLLLNEGAKSIALICSSNDFTLGVCGNIAKDLGDKVILRQDVLPTETDFKPLLLKIRDANPSFVVPILLPGRSGIFARQSRDLNIKIPIIGGAFLESTSDVDIAAGALVGAKYVMADVSDEFHAKYSTVHTLKPGSIAWSAVFYDVGRLICASQQEKVEILRYVQKLQNFPGAVGIISSKFENGDRYLSFPFVEKIITPKGFERLTRSNGNTSAKSK